MLDRAALPVWNADATFSPKSLAAAAVTATLTSDASMILPKHDLLKTKVAVQLLTLWVNQFKLVYILTPRDLCCAVAV